MRKHTLVCDLCHKEINNKTESYLVIDVLGTESFLERTDIKSLQVHTSCIEGIKIYEMQSEEDILKDKKQNKGEKRKKLYCNFQKEKMKSTITFSRNKI